MRDILLFGFIAATLLTTVRYPFAAVLMWGWFTLATPQQAAYYADQIPLNLIIAGATFIALFLHGELTRPRPTPLSWLLLLFTAWLGVSQIFSLIPEFSAPIFDRFLKILIFIIICTLVVNSRLRFHALLWLLVLTMGFFGAKGGAYTLLTLGKNIYFGLDETILYDNNHMGIALAVSLPLMRYLQRVSAVRIVRLGLILVMALSVIAIIGTNSRGAFLSLAVLAMLLWWRSNRKITGAIIGMGVGLLGLMAVPDNWTERMSTIAEADEDDSFMSRVEAWEINARLALEDPLTGVGLRVPYIQSVADTVADYEARAAHSIYFEILGGSGFVGLAIYLGVLAYGVLSAGRAERIYARAPAGRWRSLFGRYAQMSLLIFCAGGASVSMEMWDGYLIVLALISVLARINPRASTAQQKPLRDREVGDLKARIRSKLHGDGPPPGAAPDRNA